MNILFAHDHKLRYINGKYYTLGGLSDKITKRYTDLFGYMTILCRAIPRQIYDKQIFEIGNPNVKINALHSSSLFFNFPDKKNIEQAVYNSDAVIIRIPSFISIEVYKYAKKHNTCRSCSLPMGFLLESWHKRENYCSIYGNHAEKNRYEC